MDISEEIEYAKEVATLLERWKRDPILFSRLSQTIYDMEVSNIEPYNVVEFFGEGAHEFLLVLGCKLQRELIGELKYSTNDSQGLHIVGYSMNSPIVRYYGSQLEAIAKVREIPFVKKR